MAIEKHLTIIKLNIFMDKDMKVIFLGEFEKLYLVQSIEHDLIEGGEIKNPEASFLA